MRGKRIAFIGTGVMGQSMARRLMEAGHSLTVFTRTRAKASGLLEQGAQWRETAAEAAADAEFVITMVGYPSDVESVYLGEAGVLEGAPSGCIVIDMTTSSPLLAKRLADEAGKRSLSALDAPVSGGDIGAREGRLSIMVGGPEAAFQAARPLFESMGENIVHQGAAGSGQYTKMCNQIAIAGGMVAIGEAMAYGKRAGLDLERVLESIASGAASSWSLSRLAPKALAGDYAPGFHVKHFLKDMQVALDSAREMGLDLPGLELANRLYEQVAEDGGGNDGTQALFRRYLGLA